MFGRNIKRDNIKLNDFLELKPAIRRAKLPTSSEIILGLPGETKQSHFDSLGQLMMSEIDSVVPYTLKRANKSLRKLKTYLGRVIRDVGRKIAGNDRMEEAFARELLLARRVLAQERGQRGSKVYSLHAPEVECIGKGKAHKPYEFGVKVSVATPVKHCKGGQFVTHVAALPGNPYDGHTLATVIPGIEALVGNTLERIIADAGYRGHNAPPEHRFRVYTAGQKRRVTDEIKRAFKRRAAIEPVIGHLKDDHRMSRNHLAHASGDAINAVLAAVGYNFRRLIAWLRLLLFRILIALAAAVQLKSA